MARRFIVCPNCGKKGGYRTMAREVAQELAKDRLMWSCRYCKAGFWTDPDETVLEVVPSDTETE